jgi:hypothetical protein
MVGLRLSVNIFTAISVQEMVHTLAILDVLGCEVNLNFVLTDAQMLTRKHNLFTLKDVRVLLD